MDKMMKKLILLVFTAFAVAACDDECNHGLSSDGINFDFLVGSWYDEEVNEEIRYNSSGTFYDKYCNYERAAETTGRFSVEDAGHRLWYYYTLSGKNQMVDFRINDITTNSLTLKSDYALVNLHRIVATHNMNVGDKEAIETELFYANEVKSTNENVVKYSATERMLVTMGEKGTAYVKVPLPDGNYVWEKVVVGEECFDLWPDYSTLLGGSYRTMVNTLGEPEKSTYGYLYYSSVSDYIDFVFLAMDESSETIQQIDIYMYSDVSVSLIKSYMDAHYYRQLDGDSQLLYTTHETLDKSRAVYVFDKDKNVVFTMTRDRYLELIEESDEVDLWPDFTTLFGKGSNDIKLEMEQLGYSFLMTDYGYSSDGSDYYLIKDNDYITMIGHVFNRDKQLCEYWLYLNEPYNGTNTDYYNEVVLYLNDIYNYSEQESTSYAKVFYDSSNSIRITMSVDGYIQYQYLLVPGPEKDNELWPDYAAALGKSRDEIISEYGSPVSDSDSGLWFVSLNDNIEFLNFRFDTMSGLSQLCCLFLKESVTTETVVNYLGSKYNVFERGTAADGSQYAWIDGESVATSNVGVVYIPSDFTVIYQRLNNGGTSAPARIMIDLPQTLRNTNSPGLPLDLPSLKPHSLQLR